MSLVLTSEQVNQVVSNTTLVLLVRPDLLPEWQENLMDLLRQARSAELYEEAIFVSAVLALLYAPGDTLPTGTIYDYAWQTILTGLQTGMPQPAVSQGDEMTLDRLLNSVAEAVIAVMTQIPEQKDTIADELREMRGAAVEAQVDELIRWIDDLLALIAGTSPAELGGDQQGIYGAYWRLIMRSIETNSRGSSEEAI
jgi:uncharacterized protein YbcC (UPF0753/DUF2309 family)